MFDFRLIPLDHIIMKSILTLVSVFVYKIITSLFRDFTKGGGTLQYEMDIGVRLRLPNPGAFGESEEKTNGGIR